MGTEDKLWFIWNSRYLTSLDTLAGKSEANGTGKAMNGTANGMNGHHHQKANAGSPEDTKKPAGTGKDSKAAQKAKKADQRKEALKVRELRDVTVLRDINLKVTKGELIGICGSVGSGKSSLLSAVIGEMKVRVAYECTRGQTELLLTVHRIVLLTPPSCCLLPRFFSFFFFLQAGQGPHSLRAQCGVRGAASVDSVHDPQGKHSFWRSTGRGAL